MNVKYWKRGLIESQLSQVDKKANVYVIIERLRKEVKLLHFYWTEYLVVRGPHGSLFEIVNRETHNNRKRMYGELRTKETRPDVLCAASPAPRFKALTCN